MSEKEMPLKEKMGELEYRRFRRDLAKLIMHNRLKVKAEVHNIEKEKDAKGNRTDSSR